jgi:hypothetical protein
MAFESHASVRTRRAFADVCASLSEALGWPPFDLQGDVARLRGEGFEVELTRGALDPARDDRGNLRGVMRGADLAAQVAWRQAIYAFNEPPLYRFEDHYYLHSPLELEAFCDRLRAALRLPAFRFDSENENEWGYSEDAELRVHVSHAYEPDTYHEWQPKRCPPGCDYWIELQVKALSPRTRDAEWRERVWLPAWDVLLGELGGGRVYRDGRWLDF